MARANPQSEREGGEKERRRVVEHRRHLPCGRAGLRRPLGDDEGEAALEGRRRRVLGFRPNHLEEERPEGSEFDYYVVR